MEKLMISKKKLPNKNKLKKKFGQQIFFQNLIKKEISLISNKKMNLKL